MKPLYIVGTERNIGKTTASLALCHGLRKRGLRVGYMKPLGQRMNSVAGVLLHDDSQLVASLIGLEDVEREDMAVPLPSGRVQQEVFHFSPTALLDKVKQSYEALAAAHDLVIVEGMGHVAMGSCLGVSCADACRHLGAKALLVSGGGIGRAIDEISLCGAFIQSRGAELAGVIMNKIWPQKYTQVKQAATQGLSNLGIHSFGAVPFEPQLSAPTMREVHEHIGGELLGGQENLSQRVHHTIIAAMEAHHMIRYIHGNTLVITPGDRCDTILAALRAHFFGSKDKPAVSGMILTGDFRPDPSVLEDIAKLCMPVILVQEDTFTTANQVISKIFKIPPGDHERIEWAVCHFTEYVDVDAILDVVQK